MASERIEAAHQEVVRLCDGGGWRMRIPVNERDSDMVLESALDVAREALATLERVRPLADAWIEAAHNVRDVTGDYNDGREFEACAHDLRMALTTPVPVAAPDEEGL